jgi:ATP-binding cassette subfamily B (MDR/TAP) protein 1
MGVEGATKEMVEEACRAALFHEFVRDLSDGYETILGGEGAGGVALSGGQKQRLAIARARLRNPSVLVLG